MNQRIAVLSVDLAPHASDVDINDVGRGVKMQITYVLQQHGAGDDVTPRCEPDTPEA